MKIINYALVLLFTLGMLSCGSSGSDPDEIAPTVKFTGLSTDASAPTGFTAGQSVVFKASLSDNEMLKSITFTDLVQQTKTVNDFLLDFNTIFSAAKPKEASIAGKSTATVDFSVKILTGAPAGVYMLSCKVIDNSGNDETVKLYLEIE